MQTLSLSSLLDRKFVGSDDLRKGLTRILSKLPKDKELVITQNGKPRGVLMDLQTYLKVQELMDGVADYEPKLVKRVNLAVKDARKGNTFDARKVFKEMGL
ncbi:MAG: type II toxin-antitoxin system Phd/YefM family antitoxin [bacterium]|nr:type II toxin-antitoxin system Phd/YefM family antitoxin [bacterium]